MPRRKLFGLLVIGATLAAAAVWLRPAPAPVRDAKPPADVHTEPAARSFVLPERQLMGSPSGPLFAPQPQRGGVPAAQPAPVARPAAPAMPYRVAGQLVHDGALHVVLARGDAVVMAREGDTLGDGYRVETVRPDRVTLVYTPLDLRQEIAADSALSLAVAPVAGASAAGAQQTARLRWDGPARVAADAVFDVALKLTSAEAVAAAPLQLTFDPQVLEPVAVRAGGFFSDGLFTYRVYPGGSILIGASGKGAVASDAEFVVLRFKTLRTSATAELKVGAVNLHNPAGRVIAHEAPASFRTVVGR